MFSDEGPQLLFRYCFLEAALNCGQLTEPEYALSREWFEVIENNFKIDLDLIGNSIKLNGSFRFVVVAVVCFLTACLFIQFTCALLPKFL